MTRTKPAFPAIQPRHERGVPEAEAPVSPEIDRAAILVANVILICKFILKLWLFAVATLFLVANLACMGVSDAGHDARR